MARLARRERPARGSDRKRYHPDQIEPTEPATNRERMESGRDRQNGAATVSCSISILRAGRRVELPALPAQRRFISRRPIQHRVVFAPRHDGGASCRS